MGRRKGLSFYKKRRKISANVVKEIFSWLFGIAVSVFLAFVLVFSIGIKTSVIGISMEPGLYNGQTIFMNQLIYMVSKPKRGDVVVFLPNNNQNSHYYVKRVVGLPGETVQIKEGWVYINGALYEEPYDKMADYGIAENEITLGSEEYFVLGDNRNSSEDSRSGNIGNVKRDDIKGKAWFHLGGKQASIGFVK